MLIRLEELKTNLKVDILNILKHLPDFKITSDHDLEGTLPPCVIYEDNLDDGEILGIYQDTENNITYVILNNISEGGVETECIALRMSIEELMSLLNLYLEFVIKDIVLKSPEFTASIHDSDSKVLYTLCTERYSLEGVENLVKHIKEYYKIDVLSFTDNGITYLQYDNDSIKI